MRRGSRIILMSLVVLLVVNLGVLFYIFWRSATRNMVATDMVIPATLPSPQSQLLAPSSEPVNTSTRLVFIVSVLIVFVSAVLVLFRLVSKYFFKDGK
jgi:hypothetical protein